MHLSILSCGYTAFWIPTSLVMLFAIPWLEKRKADEEDLENEGGYNGVAAEGRIVEVDEDEIEDPDDAPMTMNA